MNTNPGLVLPQDAPVSRPVRQDVIEAPTNGHGRSPSDVPGVGPTWVVFAPGRLDVMGGVAECSGALVLNLPLSVGAVVAARRRDDGNVFMQSQDAASEGPRRSLSLPLAHLTDAAGQPRQLAELSAKLRELPDAAWGVTLGAWLEACRCGLLPGRVGGISLSVVNHPEVVADIGLCAALGAASLTACARVYGAELETAAAARVCRDVEYALTGLPCDVGDALSALAGEEACLWQARCQPCQAGSTLRIPDGVAIIGFDCGYRDPRRLDAYHHARAASHMGRVLIERILAHEGASDIRMDGLLARLTMNDFVERFRDRLPMKLGGAEFLQRFGPPADPCTRIQPGEVYKVRSRTEHHIYENSRSVQFAERLSRYARTKDPIALHEAGELMHASHWSYGQRCGMGSVATDRLVTLLRRQGPACGIFGAKTSGRGCGGLVVALGAESGTTKQVIESVCAEYECHSRRRPVVLSGSAGGALKREAVKL
ncbi:MAG: hypothetical protein IT449_10930 [Phycisphaerales bacterium]|nr:hypothetical protein [Phycisphaerales bacterium]